MTKQQTMTEQQTMSRPLAEADPEIWRAIQDETRRQHSQIELIASENFTSEAILEAGGTAVLLDVDRVRLKAAEVRLTDRFPGFVQAVQADITRRSSLERAAKAIFRRREVQILINNATVDAKVG